MQGYFDTSGHQTYLFDSGHLTPNNYLLTPHRAHVAFALDLYDVRPEPLLSLQRERPSSSRSSTVDLEKYMHPGTWHDMALT